MNTRATPKSVEEMSLEHIQQEIANIRERTCTDENCDDNHWPLATLDTVAALMPEGWMLYGGVTQYESGWQTEAAPTPLVNAYREAGFETETTAAWKVMRDACLRAWADTELLARFRLLLLILRKEQPHA